MTPEQTLDWLAQQHFDQCREDRPVQHWIRKMKSELPMKQPLPVQVSEYECRKLLYGFMLDCNAVGLEQAGKNLHRSMKEKNT